MTSPTACAPAPKIRSDLIRKYATAATAALFAVIGGSGPLLFFHIGEPLLKGAHEWLGLAFVAAVGLHLARNWRAFLSVVRKRRTQAAMVLAALMLGVFMATAGQGGGNPMKAFVVAAMDAPLPAVAAILDMPVADAAARLRRAGVAVDGESASLREIAAAQGIDPKHPLAVLQRQN